MHFKICKARVGLLGGMALSALAFMGTAHSAVMTYTDSTAFFAALPSVGSSLTLDFESQTPGHEVVSGGTLGGITFTYTIDGGALNMIVSSGFDTTSPDNYLGTNDPHDEIFLAGDAFTMTFGRTVNAIGLFVIATPFDSIGGDFVITVLNGSVTNSADKIIFPDEGEAYFIGLIDTVGFTSAEFTSPTFETSEFNVDDITIAAPCIASSVAIACSSPVTGVPEPGTMALFGLGVLAMGVARRRAERVSA